MTFLDYLLIVRRRWIYVAVGCLVGAVAGFVTAPGTDDSPTRYEGSHTLLVDATTASGQSLNLEQSALLATTGPVPDRVAEQLAEEGLPKPLSVAAAADLDLRSLVVTAESTTEDGAARAADLTAEEITAELSGADRALYDDQLTEAGDAVARAESLLQAVNGRLAGLNEDDPERVLIEEQRGALEAELSALRSEAQALEADGPPEPPLTSLEAATGRPVSDGVRLPESHPGRGLLFALVGALLGVAGALAADRVDTRVRGKDDAERAFDLPVIAEIPPLPGRTSGRELLVATKPAAPFVEAYRALRTVVLFTAAEAAQIGSGPPTNGAPVHSAQVVLITSPSAGEGKTTTAAHLAAVLAESEKRTLLISADFRRPRVHEYFGVPREPGLADVLESGAGRVRLSTLQMNTSFAGVHLLPSGRPVNNPAHLLTETRHLIAAARQLFDFIVIDTPPLLVANDATELAVMADMVILVAKADRTSRSAAGRSTEVLRRVDAPLLGVLVSAAHDTPTAYGYYRYRYYAESDDGSKRGGRPKADDRAPVEAGQA